MLRPAPHIAAAVGTAPPSLEIAQIGRRLVLAGGHQQPAGGEVIVQNAGGQGTDPEGSLIPTRKDQAPPDLRYFKLKTRGGCKTTTAPTPGRAGWATIMFRGS